MNVRLRLLFALLLIGASLGCAHAIHVYIGGEHLHTEARKVTTQPAEKP